MDSTFEINRGSDLTFSFNWPDGAGGNANLTGYDVIAFEPNALIADHITVTLEDAATGLIKVRIEWKDTLQTGLPLGFRVQVSLGIEQQSTNEMTVLYK